MKFKFALPLMMASSIISTAAFAEQYQSITEADYLKEDSEFGSVDGLLAASVYYFGARNTVGPLKEFGYINNVSNIQGAFAYIDTDAGSADLTVIGGEYFAGQVKFGGSITNSDFLDAYSASIGYLFTPNALLEVEANKTENLDTELTLRGQYNHQISATDYLGFTVEVDDEFDRRSVSSKYLTELSGGRYLTVELGLADYDGADLFWEGEAEFFFNKNSSVGLVYDEQENYEFNASHFFNRNVAGKVAYGSNSDFDDMDVYSLGVIVQL